MLATDLLKTLREGKGIERTSDGSNPRNQYLALDEPTDQHETGAAKSVGRLQHVSLNLLEVSGAN